MTPCTPIGDHSAQTPADDGRTASIVGRRDFVKLTSTGLLVLFTADLGCATQQQAESQVGTRRPPLELNGYLHVGADGRVTCFVGKVELGQGVTTSLAQLVAEELDVPFESVDMILGDTDLCPTDDGTSGSTSIWYFGRQLRQAGAEARGLLLQLAAERLGVPETGLTVSDGIVSASAAGGKQVSYAQLVDGRRIEHQLQTRPGVKSPKAFKVMGKSVARRDALDKVTGRAKYSGDIVPPGGALHARLLRLPAFGASLTALDTSRAEAVPGVRVVRDRGIVAVLHEHRDEAEKALELVKAEFRRSEWPIDQDTIFDQLLKTARDAGTAAQAGQLQTGERLASEVIERTYFDCYRAHAPMEPHTAVAAVENGKITIWAGTQAPFPLKQEVMQALGWSADKVRVITPYVGGAFGGKLVSPQAVEAAHLAVLVGKPVRVTWSREEEFFLDTFQPAAIIKIRSGVDSAKKIVLWDYKVYCAGPRAAQPVYNIPHHRIAVAYAPHPFNIGSWRAPGAGSNVFARESQIDVMASRSGVDPVDFRQRNLTDQRMLRVLTTAAKKFGWTPKPGPSGRGYGVACSIDSETYVCMMAEVAVDKSTGQVTVKRMVCAQEMGVVVNPEGALQQIEGCITMGLGTLTEEVRFKGGDVLDRNFDTYELPRFSRLPQIEAVIVDAPEIPSTGGGEPGIPPVGAAIANAIFDAVGKRVYRMPMTPERVKKALATNG
jgi:nicotinate dehydrogenase subunit B